MIYERPKNEIFASDAKAGEMVEFPNIKRGWGVTENLGFIPPMEYFNAAFNRVDKSLAYQLQRGVSEWSAEEEYPAGAVSVFNSKLYQAKATNTNKKPPDNKDEWGAIASEAWGEQTFLKKTATAADSEKLGGMVASVSEISNTIAQRTAEGDLRARYLRCGHVELQAPTQDNLMGTASELIFRNAEDKYERATSLVRVLQCLNSIQSGVAWMDSDVITPDNKNQVGYARLPGGFIIQFGMTHRLATGEARTQIFPIAFPHACFVVLCSPHLPLPDNGLLSPYTQAWSTTSCTVKNVDSDSSCHIAWIAIGN